MKPANFPARKNRRRLGALARLGTHPKTKLSAAEINVETARIQANLNPNARAVRTKKVRGTARS